MHRYVLAALLMAQAPVPAGELDLQSIVAKVRETYATARAWHFEHRIVIEETAGTGPAVTLADVSLISSNRVSAGGPGGIATTSICAERCRLSATPAGGAATLLVRDGTTNWLYTAASGEYRQGPQLRSITGSVAGPMLLAAHAGPLGGLEAQAWSGVTLIGNDALEIDGKRRDCFVIEATLKSSGPSLADIGVTNRTPSADVSYFAVPSGLFGMLQLQGMAASRTPVAYFATQGAALTTLRLWIDKERFVVLRRVTTQPAEKITAELAQPAAPTPPAVQATLPVSLRAVDTFTRALLENDVQDTMFAFQPPAGSRDVSNVRTPAGGVLSQPIPSGTRDLVRTRDVLAYYKELPDNLTISIETPSGWSSIVFADVNQDGKMAAPDVAYGMSTGDRVCGQSVTSETSNSACGTFVTKATLQVTATADRRTMVWVIPKKELSSSPDSARFEIRTWTGSSWNRYSGPYPYLVLFSVK